MNASFQETALLIVLCLLGAVKWARGKLSQHALLLFVQSLLPALRQEKAIGLCDRVKYIQASVVMALLYTARVPLVYVHLGCDSCGVVRVMRSSPDCSSTERSRRGNGRGTSIFREKPPSCMIVWRPWQPGASVLPKLGACRVSRTATFGERARVTSGCGEFFSQS